MKTLAFLRRTTKEILRDPITLIFGAGFPLILLLLLSFMNRHIPVEAGMSLFEIETLLPGVIVFGFSFLALFGGLLLSEDRESAFLRRLFCSPLTATDFLLGYALPLVALGLCQALLCVLFGFFFSLPLTPHLLTMLVVLLPPLLLFVSIGLLVGSLLGSKQVGSLCGALLTNVSAWLSGTWFALELLGDGFVTFAHILPFANAVDAARAALAGDVKEAILPSLIVLAYAAATTAAAILAFKKKMKE